MWTDPTLGSSSGPYIVEYACGSGNYGNQILYQCPAGCSNGVCNPVAPFCTDSDGGINYNTRGTATTEQGQFPDYCTDAGKLKEYSCSGISKVVTTYECSNECFSGACVNLYFGDSQGNNLTNYSSKHVGDIIYLWVKNPPFTFSQTDSFKLKESDSGEGLFNPDDTIRSGLGSFTLFSGTSIGTQITLFQSDIDACSPSGESLEGANCEFYFEIVNDGITYFSQKNSPYLRVPVNYSGLGLNDNLQRYWADSNDLSIKWNSLSYTGQARTVGLVMLNSSGAIANEEDGPTASIVFHIYAQDDSIESPPYDFGSYNGNFYDVDEDGEADDAYYLWTINDNVINTVSSYDNDGSYQFYFEVESGTSSVLTVTQNLGTCGNGICEPPAENETNCDDCLASCAGVNYCMDYVTQDSCLNDFCDVASQTPPPAGPGQTDACGWNSYSDPACNKAIYSITGNGSSIGSCVSEQNSMSEECNGGFLSYSWTSKWTWYPGNSFSTEVLCEAYSLDCEGNCLQELGKNIWHCDPDGSAASCIDGSAQIPCPAQIQLNFFDLKNLIVAVLLIFVLYVILHKTRQSKKKYKKSSKK
ncbi:MAG: hypothetical protein Q8Q04_03690 [archaeon]|nr:hypothetical protein [archaeon]